MNSSPLFIVFDVTLSLNDIDFKGTPTVTLQVAVFPFSVVAVILQLPFPTAVTVPSCDTVATALLLDFHVTVLSPSAFAGNTVATNFSVWSFSKSNVVLFKVTPVTGCFTVIITDDVVLFAPVAVIVAVPFPTAVTTPLLTVATFSSLDVYVTPFWFVPSGVYFTVKLAVSPTINSLADEVKDIDSNGKITSTVASVIVDSIGLLLIPSCIGYVSPSVWIAKVVCPIFASCLALKVSWYTVPL